MKTPQVLLASVALVALVAADDAGARNHTAIGVQEVVCRPPQGGDSPGLNNWYYNSKAEGPYGCTENHDSRPWAMLNAYREGGTEGVHWKYTDNPQDRECLVGWNYYAADGRTFITSVPGAITGRGKTRYWCALRVYRSGGVEGKQWEYCDCNYIRDPVGPPQ